MRAKHLNFLTPEQPECQLSLNMQTQIYPSTLNLHTEKLDKLIEDLDNKFPPQIIHPKEDINSIMYKAGQQSVVEYVKQLLE
mgnify:FL=1|tara:strand:- start:2873 stop:3118 length:246 start_codon:yes stop_codon:yes gene_type:complete